MARPTRARLNTQALLHNLQQVRRHAPRARVMAVVKANAYGHGLAWVATTLKGRRCLRRRRHRRGARVARRRRQATDRAARRILRRR